MRSIEPGDADSNPFGAVYHGSCEGGRGVDASRVGKARDRVAKRQLDNNCVENIFEVLVSKPLNQNESIRLTGTLYYFAYILIPLIEIGIGSHCQREVEDAARSPRLPFRAAHTSDVHHPV
jgi:hypothetical protein